MKNIIQSNKKMMDKLRVGIIGYGKMGKKRLDILQRSNCFEVVGICDSNHEFKEVFHDYKELLEMDLDCVFVCVPHTLTTNITVDCLKKGLHVFAEKPPGLCTDDVLLMHKAKKDCILQFGFNHRYYKHSQMLKNMLDCKKNDELLWFRGQYGRTKNEGWRLKEELGGRGIFISQGLHMLDLILWYSGHYNDDDHMGVVGATVSHYKHDTWFEDNVFILLESELGKTASIHSSCTLSKNMFNLWCQMKGGWVELRGVNTSTKSFDYPERIQYGDNNDSFYYGNPPMNSIVYEHDFSWNVEVDNFVANIVKKPDCFDYDCSSSEALMLMRLVDEIYARSRIREIYA